MKAVLCKAWGPPESLVVEDVPSPVAGPGEVLVEVHAAGVNYPDALIIQKKYQVHPELPFSPGAEVAGIVRAVGEGVKPWKPGDRVIANVPSGGYAQELVADAARVVPIPDGMDFPTASAYVLAYGTSLFALKDRAKLAAGETLLVLGAAGGVGTSAIEIGKCLGAKVIAAASSADKLAYCREHGADETIDYTKEDLKERAKALSGGGVDVVYDPAGGDHTQAALRAMAWEGRLLIVGFASGAIPKLPANLVLLKSCQIVGVFWGAFAARDPAKNRAHAERVLGWLAEGKVRPHLDAVLPFDRAGEALEKLARREVKGKIVLVP